MTPALPKDAEFLKKIPIFQDLTNEEIWVLANFFEGKDYVADIKIVKEGEKGDRLFVIESGNVAVTRSNDKGEDIFITALQTGDYFGEAALFDDVQRIANIKTTLPTRAHSIDKSHFDTYLKENPVAANRILYRMLKQVFLRLKQTSFELKFERESSLGQNAIDKLFA